MKADAADACEMVCSVLDRTDTFDDRIKFRIETRDGINILG